MNCVKGRALLHLHVFVFPLYHFKEQCFTFCETGQPIRKMLPALFYTELINGQSSPA